MILQRVLLSDFVDFSWMEMKKPVNTRVYRLLVETTGIIRKVFGGFVSFQKSLKNVVMIMVCRLFRLWRFLVKIQKSEKFVDNSWMIL